MKKICTFVINGENKILLLLGSDKDPQFHRSFWYVVTGGCEDYDDTIEDTVKREVKEETGLNVKENIYLNWIFKYESLGQSVRNMYMHHLWMNGEIVLNEESIDFKWCDIDDFVNLIEWTGDKRELKNVLVSAINKKIYFKDIKIDQNNINIKIFAKLKFHALLFILLFSCKDISKILLELYEKNIIKQCILMYFYHVYGRIK